MHTKTLRGTERDALKTFWCLHSLLKFIQGSPLIIPTFSGMKVQNEYNGCCSKPHWLPSPLSSPSEMKRGKWNLFWKPYQRGFLTFTFQTAQFELCGLWGPMILAWSTGKPSVRILGGGGGYVLFQGPCFPHSCLAVLGLYRPRPTWIIAVVVLIFSFQNIKCRRKQTHYPPWYK